MTKKPEQTTPIIDWDPASGFLLCKPLKREELARLYNRDAGSLQLPDRMGKVSDSVGAGQVVKLGGRSVEDKKLEHEYHTMLKAGSAKVTIMPGMLDQIKVGDYVAWMPYTDQLIEIDGVKYSLVGYDKIRAVRKGDSK